MQFEIDLRLDDDALFEETLHLNYCQQELYIS